MLLTHSLFTKVLFSPEKRSPPPPTANLPCPWLYLVILFQASMKRLRSASSSRVYRAQQSSSQLSRAPVKQEGMSRQLRPRSLPHTCFLWPLRQWHIPRHIINKGSTLPSLSLPCLASSKTPGLQITIPIQQLISLKRAVCFLIVWFIVSLGLQHIKNLSIF